MSGRPASAAAVVVTGVGALSPVGGDAPQTCASLRAGIARIGEHAWYECLTPDPGWDPEDPLLAGSVSLIDPWLDGVERLLALAAPALAEVCRDGGLKRADLPQCALLLSLPPEDEAVAPLALERELPAQLLRRTGLDGLHSVRLNRSGHTGFFELLDRARQLLASGEVDTCLVGGIDSYLLANRLRRMDEAWRLRSQRTVDGFAPGEAAVLLLLEKADHAGVRGAQPRAELGPVGLGREERPLTGDRQSTGRGLDAAVAAVRAGGAPWSWVLCDLNGESYRGYEWGLLNVRQAAALADPLVLQTTADCVGDVGAASGALLAAWACEAWRRGYAPADEALLWTAADDDRRAALTLRRPGAGQKG